MRQKHLLSATAVILLVGVLLSQTAIHAFAGSADEADEADRGEICYTSMEIQEGESLWSIAQTYAFGSGMNVQTYIEEVCRINHLSDSDRIHEGSKLIVPYVSYEEN